MKRHWYIAWLLGWCVVGLSAATFGEGWAMSSFTQIPTPFKDGFRTLSCTVCQGSLDTADNFQYESEQGPSWRPIAIKDWTISEALRMLDKSMNTTGNEFRSQFGVGGIGSIPPSGSGSEYLPRILAQVALQQRYDSNVFFTTPQAGVKRDDFVTMLMPRLSFTPQKESLVTGAVTINGTGAVYAHYSNLNYVSGGASAFLDFSKLVQQAIPRLRLQLFDTVSYTPVPPAFLGGQTDTGTAVPIDQGASNPSFVNGLQFQQTNTLTNSAGMTTTYDITPTISILGTATYAFQRFGATRGTEKTVNLVDTDTRSLIVGPVYTFSMRDQVRVVYTHSRTDFSGDQTGQALPYFETDGGSLFWRHLFSPTLVGTLSYGMQQVVPGHKLQYLGQGALTWTQFPNIYTFSYSRQVAPGFLGAGNAVISDLVAMSVDHLLAERWRGNIVASYAHSSSIATGTTGGGNNLTFDTFSAITGLTYQFSPVLIGTLGYQYTRFISEGLSSVSGITGESITFDKHVIYFQIQHASWF